MSRSGSPESCGRGSGWDVSPTTISLTADRAAIRRAQTPWAARPSSGTPSGPVGAWNVDGARPNPPALIGWHRNAEKSEPAAGEGEGRAGGWFGSILSHPRNGRLRAHAPTYHNVPEGGAPSPRGDATGGYIVHFPEDADVKAIRTKVGRSQERFALRYGFSPALVVGLGAVMSAARGVIEIIQMLSRKRGELSIAVLTA